MVAAAQEERFTRRKHDPSFPARAVAACLRQAGAEESGLDLVAFYDKPLLKFERLLESYLWSAPRGFPSFVKAMPQWVSRKMWMRDLIRQQLPAFGGEVLFFEHHESHAASAFYPSPFERAAILTMDGVGEWATASIGAGRGSEVELLREIRFPHSLGLLYSAFTYYTGFRVNSGEYKVMGLAPYGEPRYAGLIRERLLDLADDGSFRMDMRYFDYVAGLTMTNRRFHRLFGGPPRRPESPVTQRDMDLAASVQAVTEEVMLRMARTAVAVTGERDLCLAGGVALNCVGNGRILREGVCDRLWIQPASGDAGGALGAALAAWHLHAGGERRVSGGRDAMRGGYLGPEFPEAEIAAYLDGVGAVRERVPAEELPRRVAALLAKERVVGWFQGRMEFGPRALGGRSILGDARSPRMQSVMNLKIKFRESFRPFAPSVLAEKAGEWFDLAVESPYMLLVAPVREERRLPPAPGQAHLFGIEKLNLARSTIPAVTHVDHSARVQTVDGVDNPLYHALLREFELLTGCPVIINTSFNVRGEPIVGSPEDAYRCFMRTQMDDLALGPFLLRKEDQPAWVEEGDWRDRLELD